jgi:hypothetical protein
VNAEGSGFDRKYKKSQPRPFLKADRIFLTSPVFIRTVSTADKQLYSLGRTIKKTTLLLCLTISSFSAAQSSSGSIQDGYCYDGMLKYSSSHANFGTFVLTTFIRPSGSIWRKQAAGDTSAENHICCQGDPSLGVSNQLTTCTAGTEVPRTKILGDVASRASSIFSSSASSSAAVSDYSSSSSGGAAAIITAAPWIWVIFAGAVMAA